MTLMKAALMNCIAVLFGICLIASCSTNTQKENTGVGAVTGAVIGGLAGSAIGQGTGQVVAIGVGAVAGALLGGYIGKSMDSSDKANSYQAMNNPTNHPGYWKNTKTGAVYKVTPISGMMTINGNPNCRKYIAKSTMHGKKQTTRNIACRQADGTWQTI